MSISPNQRLYAMSRNPQSNYQTPTAPNVGAPFNFVHLLLESKAVASFKTITANNRGHSTGQDFANDQYTLNHDVDGAFDAHFSFEQIGYMLYATLGIVVSRMIVAGVYEHIFTPLNRNVTNQLPAFTWAEKLGVSHNVTYPSCVMDSLSFNGDGLDRIKVSGAMKGSGKRTTNAGLDHATGVLRHAHNFAQNTQTVLTLNDGTADTLFACRFKSWNWQWQNNLNAADGYRAGCQLFQVANDSTSGAIRSQLEIGDRDLSCGFKVDYDGNPDLYLALQNQTQLSLKYEITGRLITGANFNKLTLNHARAPYESVEVQEDGGVYVQNVSVKPLLKFDLSQPLTSITLINSVPSYQT